MRPMTDKLTSGFDKDRARQSSFVPAPAKLTLATIEDPGLQVAAQYNPKEIQLTQPVTWAPHAVVGATKADAALMEFGGMQPQTTQVELFFDAFETGGTLPSGKTIAETIELLKKMAAVIDAASYRDEDSRPYNVVVTWGVGGFPKFLCVIESMVTKYTVFGPTGTALRAIVTLSLKEACLRKMDLQLRAEKHQNDHVARLKTTRGRSSST